MRVVIVHQRERAWIELARHDRLSELTDVPALLPSQTGTPQGGFVESRDDFWCYRACDALEPHVRRSPGGERHLLLEDDLDECLEARRAIPQRRRAVAFDDRGQVPIAPSELGDSVSERLMGELTGHVSQTREPTFL